MTEPPLLAAPPTWLAAFLLLLAVFVPGGALLGDLDARRARARRMVRLGAAACVLFHAWAALRGVEVLEVKRALGPRLTPGDWVRILAAAAQAASAGWTALAGAVVLAGIVVRGAPGGRGKSRAVLGILVAAVAAFAVALGLPGSPPPDQVEAWRQFGLPVFPRPWEARVFPVLLVAWLAAAIVAFAAAIRVARASGAGDEEARESARLWLSGAGIVLLCMGMVSALGRWYLVAQDIAILGPKLTARDWRAVPGSFVLPGILVLAGVVPAAFGLLHLRRRGRGGAGAPEDPVLH